MTTSRPATGKVANYLRRYLSGKLAAIQLLGGVGAFAGRSLAAYFSRHEAVWLIMLLSQVGSFGGYLAVYVVGYWLAFRRDYRLRHRSMPADILRLQLVEQVPNLGTAIPSALTQGVLIGEVGMSPVVSANLASWFGPHKAINFLAMLASNSLKKAMVDGTWKPSSTASRRLEALGRLLSRKPGPGASPVVETMPVEVSEGEQPLPP